jgi:hypothetical protein
MQLAVGNHPSCLNLASNLLYVDIAFASTSASSARNCPQEQAPREFNAIAKANLIFSFDGTGANQYENFDR